MRDWWPNHGLLVNAGRQPTRIGGDRIAPFLDVPHWFTSDIVRMLRRHRVDFTIDLAFVRSRESDDPDDQSDRFSFPRLPAEQVQALVDGITPRHVRAARPGYGAAQ